MEIIIKLTKQSEATELLAFLQQKKPEVAEKKLTRTKTKTVEAAAPAELTPTVEAAAPAELTPTVEAAAPAELTPTVEAAKVDVKACKKLAIELIQLNKNVAVTGIIKATGAISLSKIPEDQLNDVYAKLQALKGGA